MFDNHSIHKDRHVIRCARREDLCIAASLIERQLVKYNIRHGTIQNKHGPNAAEKDDGFTKKIFDEKTNFAVFAETRFDRATQGLVQTLLPWDSVWAQAMPLQVLLNLPVIYRLPENVRVFKYSLGVFCPCLQKKTRILSMGYIVRGILCIFGIGAMQTTYELGLSS